MDETLDVKKTRIQLSEYEIKTLIHHLTMEEDSLQEVLYDLIDNGDDKDAYQTDIELNNLKTLKGKLQKTYNKLLKK